jgi:hypothetical protein
MPTATIPKRKNMTKAPSIFKKKAGGLGKNLLFPVFLLLSFDIFSFFDYFVDHG